jgi:two-component system, chemotaxis family, CheB/CheR fusion protein
MNDIATNLPLDPSSDIEPPIEALEVQPPRYVVAIGASAGGLDALERLFDKLPADSGAAFVVIQHLSPDHKSIMDSLLARHTAMPVVTVTHNMRMLANSVYLIPAGSLMQLEGDRFLLTPKSPRILTLPIDVFFQSLAANYKEFSVGVVLSGTGSDGTRGAGAINEAGGVLMAQQPESAKFDGMPRSIISTGLVDVILPIEAIAERIYSHVITQGKSDLALHSTMHEGVQDTIEQTYSRLLALLNQVGGINFADYKAGTVMRRIERRMAVRQVNSLEEYLVILSADESEVLTLRRELLIPVTSFFRDPDAYEALKTQVVSELLARKSEDRNIRVWCAGTSTGEEAYSIAMLFLECFEEAKYWPSLKIFATDVNQENIDVGSAGIYPESIMAELSPEQLDRFFQRRENHFVVKNELRQRIVFAKHNLLVDPPFTKMDLVVCRNVLIYFKPDAQMRVLNRLQFALKPNSFLFLGSSESLGTLQDDFEIISQRQKIWRVIKSNSSPLELGFPMDGRRENGTVLAKSTQALHALNRSVVQRGYDALIKAFSPPAAVLVSANLQVLHSYGQVNRFMLFRPGQASLELSRFLPEALSPVASALLYKTLREGTSTTSDLVRLQLPNAAQDSAKVAVRLSAWPVAAREDESKKSQMALLVFEEVTEFWRSQSPQTVDVEFETNERMQVLQHELAATRESLQATIEELETSNEELQATNEEMMASNEELQSSNEELQSVNEELNTVNSEYQEKIEILNRVNADLDNLAKVVASGTIFVDEELHVSRFSPDATEIFKLRQSDLGRPLSDISHILNYPSMADDLKLAIETSEMQERNVAGGDKSYLVKMLPYQVPSSSKRGLVINFIDVTSVRQAHKLQKVLDASFASKAVMAENGEIILCNGSWRHGSSIFDADCNPSAVSLGANYLDYFKDSKLDWAQKVYAEITAIGAGQRESAILNFEGNKYIIFSAKRLDEPVNSILIEVIAQDKKV